MEKLATRITYLWFCRGAMGHPRIDLSLENEQERIHKDFFSIAQAIDIYEGFLNIGYTKHIG